MRTLVGLVAALLFASCAKTPNHEPTVAGPTAAAPAGDACCVSSYATVNGVRLHYLSGATEGAGTPVVLVHGYAQTSRMWRPLIAALEGQHAVIAPDLRGAGSSDRPAGGYDKATLARDIHALAQSLGHKRVKIVGHDIGLMVAYAYAAQFPEDVESIVLMDAFLPGIGAWQNVWLMRDLWHFHFNGETPLKLVAGRERTYFEHFWNDFAADPTHSVSEEDRRFYASAYAQPGGMRAAFEYFRAVDKDKTDFAELSQKKLEMPMLVLTGEKASGTALIEQACLVAKRVDGVVVPGTGHWLIDEAPGVVIPKLRAFLDDDAPPSGTSCAAESSGEVRLTAGEIDAHKSIGGGPGTSGVGGIRTSVLKGDPTQTGLYTIVLHVPANTRIDAHFHADDRVATVVSGTWYIGYGTQYDEKALKPLTAGSFYTEPPNAAHFAKTGSTPVVVQISGYGPTSTKFISSQ